MSKNYLPRNIVKRFLVSTFLLVMFFTNTNLNAQEGMTLGGVTADNSATLLGESSNDVPFTGDLNYNIPIISLPGLKGYDYTLTIQYSSSIMDKQKATWVGMGWTLKTGDITRTVRKRPDEQHVTMFGSNSFKLDIIGGLGCGSGSSCGTYAIELDDIEQKNGMFHDDRHNEEWDSYMLNFSSSSHEIAPATYGAQAEYYNNDDVLITLPHYIHFTPLDYKPFDIRWTTSVTPKSYPLTRWNTRDGADAGKFIQGFRVTDGDGFTHYFEEIEHIELSEYDVSPYSGLNYKFPTSWKLNKIVSPYSKDEINFTYYSNHKQRFSRSDHEIVLGEYKYGLNIDMLQGEGYKAEIDYDNKYPQYVESETHRLEFIITDRDDLADDDWKFSQKLDEIILIEKSTNTIIKRVVFGYNYSSPKSFSSDPVGTSSQYEENHNLTLRNIRIIDSQGQEVEYDFKYNFDNGIGDVQSSCSAPCVIQNKLGYQSGTNALWKINTPAGLELTYEYERDRRLWDFFRENQYSSGLPNTCYDSRGVPELLESEIYDGGIRLKSKTISNGFGDTYKIDYDYGDGVLNIVDYLDYQSTLWNYSRNYSGSIHYRDITSVLPDGSKIVNSFTSNIKKVFATEFLGDAVRLYTWIKFGDGPYKLYEDLGSDINGCNLVEKQLFLNDGVTLMGPIYQEESKRHGYGQYRVTDRSLDQGNIYKTKMIDPNGQVTKEINREFGSTIFINEKFNSTNESVIVYPGTPTLEASLYPRRNAVFGTRQLNSETTIIDGVQEKKQFYYKNFNFVDTYDTVCSIWNPNDCSLDVVKLNDENFILPNLYLPGQDPVIPYRYEDPNDIGQWTNAFGDWAGSDTKGRLPINNTPFRIATYVDSQTDGLPQLESTIEYNFAFEMYKDQNANYRSMYDMNMRNQVYSIIKAKANPIVWAFGPKDLNYYPTYNLNKSYSIWEYINDSPNTGVSNFDFLNLTKWRQSENWIWNGVSETITGPDGNNQTIVPFVPTSNNSIKHNEILSFDEYGNPTSSIDALGVITSYTYTDDGQHLTGTFKNTNPDQAFAHSFAYDGLSGWSQIDYDGDNDTQYSIVGGRLRFKNLNTAVEGEKDRVYIDLGAGLNSKVVLEFDVTIDNSDNWSLNMGVGSSAWDGLYDNNRGIWTAFNNESWSAHNGSTWSTIKSNLTIGETYSFKIIADPSTYKADYYVNGKLELSGFNFMNNTTLRRLAFGNYGHSNINSEWFIDNVRVYPLEGLAASFEIDPINLRPISIKDETGITSRSSISGINDGNVTINIEDLIIGTSGIYNSKTFSSSDVFESSSPHKAEAVQFNEIIYSTNFSHAQGWTISPSSNIDFGEDIDGKMGVKMSSNVLNDTKSISRNSNSSKLILSVDFKPEDATSIHSVRFTDSNKENYFSVQYDEINEDFRIKYRKNAGTPVSPQSAFDLDIDTDSWYTIQIQKIDDQLLAWVFPKGSARSEGNYYSTTGFPSSWEPIVEFETQSNNPHWLTNLVLAKSAIVNSSYHDAIGKSLQIHISNGEEAVLSGSAFDQIGRKVVDTKPIYLPHQNGYRSSLLGATFGGGGTALPINSDTYFYFNALSNISTDDAKYAYSFNKLEPGLLGRTEIAISPGKNSFDNLGENTSFDYSKNQNSSENFDIYDTGQLRKLITTDGEGNKVITYSNVLGRTIASGIDVNKDNILDESTTDLVTKFEYDELGNLISVEDPRGLVTTYSYNVLGQLVEKKLPDQDHPNKYCYDKKGRLRFHANPNDFDDSFNYYGTDHYSYSYTKYDVFDRPIEIGEQDASFTSSNSQASFNIICQNSTLLNDQNEPSANNTATIIYDYDGVNLSFGAQNYKGRLTQARYKDQNSGQWGYTWYSYNTLGLVEWVRQRLPGRSSYDDRTISYTYDEIGRVTKVSYDEGYSSTNDHYFWYYYDEFGKLEKVTSYGSNSEGSALTEAEYTYYADGQVEQLRLGDGAQVVDYDYTIQGWLDNINNGISSGTDQFGMTLDYANNGNISEQQWSQAAFSTGTYTYFYEYDSANRLEKACYEGVTCSSTGDYDVTYDYDDNGNIDFISRNGAGSEPDLDYTINIPSGTNKIAGVGVDGISGETQTQTKLFDYDASGNVTKNEVQGLTSNGVGITAVTYDWRNLPISLSANGSTLTYVYDADGNRVKKKIGTTETWYVRGADGQTIAAYQGSTLLYLNILAGGQIIGQIQN